MIGGHMLDEFAATDPRLGFCFGEYEFMNVTRALQSRHRRIGPNPLQIRFAVFRSRRLVVGRWRRGETKCFAPRNRDHRNDTRDDTSAILAKLTAQHEFTSIAPRADT